VRGCRWTAYLPEPTTHLDPPCAGDFLANSTAATGGVDRGGTTLRNHRRQGGCPCAGATPRPCCGPPPPAGGKGCRSCAAAPRRRSPPARVLSPTGMSPPASPLAVASHAEWLLRFSFVRDAMAMPISSVSYVSNYVILDTSSSKLNI
jgi:hypothetical protein